MTRREARRRWPEFVASLGAPEGRRGALDRRRVRFHLSVAIVVLPGPPRSGMTLGEEVEHVLSLARCHLVASDGRRRRYLPAVHPLPPEAVGAVARLVALQRESRDAWLAPFHR